MQKLIGLIIFVGALVSCSTTGIKTEPLPYALQVIKTEVTKTIPAEIENISPNGREYYSELFALPPKFAKRVGKTRDGKLLERAWAKVIILGERRPYTLHISVFTQELGLNEYESTGENKKYADYLGKRIKKSLVQRHENMDLIDDFRPF